MTERKNNHQQVLKRVEKSVWEAGEDFKYRIKIKQKSKKIFQ